MENGDETSVRNPAIRAEVMALITSWSALITNDGVMAGAGGGQDMEDGHSAEDEAKMAGFIQFVLLHKRTVLIELATAAHALQRWPLFELCAKTMAKLIEQAKTLAQVKLALGVTDNHGIKLSLPVIKGFLKHLHIEKRLELDASDLTNEWQLAFNSVWSQVKVLFFGSGTSTFKTEQCKHNVANSNELNTVNSSEKDWKANITSIKATRRRKVPEKFLDIIRKCVNLEIIVWDKKFGQMADTKLARVLEQNCPHLEHIEGTITKEFEFDANGRCLVSPASFLDTFEPTKSMTCFKVSYQQDKAPAGENISFVLLIGAQTTNTDISITVKKKKDEFKANLRPILATVLAEPSKDDYYAIDKAWFDKFTTYVVTDSNDKPGKIDHNTIVAGRDEDGKGVLKPGLEIFHDYVLLPKESFAKLKTAFGWIRYNG